MLLRLRIPAIMAASILGSISGQQCSLCQQGDNYYSTRYSTEVVYDGSNVTCSEVESMLFAEESISEMCTSAKESTFEACCYEPCSLCGDSSGIRDSLSIDYQGSIFTCGEVVYTSLYQLEDGSDECNAARDSLAECCYEYPQDPCSLCQQGYDYFNTKGDVDVEYDGSNITCGQVESMLYEEESSSATCMTAKESLVSNCCYESCSLCGDSSGMRESLSIEYQGSGYTCGEISSSLFEVEEGSDECNTAREAAVADCCYELPQDQCGLCQQEYDYFNTKYDVEVEYDGSNITCGQVESMLYAEESSSSTCTSTKESLFSECCYESCSLCGDLGMRESLSFDYQGSSYTCGEISSSLFEVEEGSDECNAAREAAVDDCCYELPQDQCGLCQREYDYISTKYDVEVEYDESNITCGQVESMLYAEESSSATCTSAKESLFSECCYESCSLCGDLGMRESLSIEYQGSSYTCGEISSRLFEVQEGSDECNAAREAALANCCYELPQDQCGLCQREYNYLNTKYDVEVEYDGSDVTCGQVESMLYAEESSSAMCTSAKDSLFSNCCYASCSLCSDLGMRDWLVIDYEGRSYTCGEISSRLYQVEDGSDECSGAQESIATQCCFEYPQDQCSLCQQGYDYFNTKYDVDVEYDGSMVTCSQIESMLYAVESSSTTCTSTKESVFGNCCYESCSLCGDLAMRDWLVIDYDSSISTCGEISSNIYEFEAGSDQCNTARDSLVEECCYEYPRDQCSLCQQGFDYFTTQYDVNVEYDGSTITCGDVERMLYEVESISEMCTFVKESTFGDCCYKPCNICGDSDLSVSPNVMVDYEEASVSCSSLESILYAGDVEEGSEQCNTIQSSFSESCCFEQCGLCTGDFRLDYEATADYQGQSIDCGSLEGILYSDTVEEGSDQCSSTQQDYSTACCVQNCTICVGGTVLPHPTRKIPEVDDDLTCGAFEEVINLSASPDTPECSAFQATAGRVCSCPNAPAPECDICAANQELNLLELIPSGALSVSPGDLGDYEMVCGEAVWELSINPNLCNQYKDQVATHCCVASVTTTTSEPSTVPTGVPTLDTTPTSAPALPTLEETLSDPTSAASVFPRADCVALFTTVFTLILLG